MNDIHNNENISQEEEFLSPGQEKVNGKATPEQSGPSTGEPREQPGEPTEEAVEIEETEEIEIIDLQSRKKKRKKRKFRNFIRSIRGGMCR